MLFSFADLELDVDQLELRRAGTVVKVEPQVFAILELLVANAHRVVSKEEINEKVWGGRIVSDAALSSRIRSARQAVGDDGRAQRWIKTVRDRGFRFIGEVTTTATHPSIVEIGAQRRVAPVEAASTQPERPSIAVLPLRLLSDTDRYASLADAISHEVITDLSRLHWLHVISSGSSFRFRAADADVREVGGLLGVRYVLSGSLTLFAERASLTVELCEVATGAVLWADSIERSLDELLQVWREISAKIVSRIEGRIESHEVDRVAPLPTDDLDAWSAYYRGRWHMYRFNPHDNAVATRHFEQALERDPGFGRAHAGLSFVHYQDNFLGFSRQPEASALQALRHAEAAYRLDEHDPLIVLSMGRALILSGRWEEASSWLDRATELNPNFAWAYYHRTLSAAILHDGAGAVEHAERAIGLSPVDPLVPAMHGSCSLGEVGQGRLDSAADWADRGASLPGAHVVIFAIAAAANGLAGRRETAERWADALRALERPFQASQFFRSTPLRNVATRNALHDQLEALGF